MSTSAEWFRVLALGSIWATILGVLLLNLSAEKPNSRNVWFWFGASLFFVGLTSGMVQVFGWGAFHGYLLLSLGTSVIGLCISGLLYRHYIRSACAFQYPPDLDATAQPQSHDREEVLRYLVDKAIDQTGYQKIYNKKRASFIKLATLIFSTTATILLGLKGLRAEDTFKNIAFMFSAAVTLLTALEPYFNFRSFWVEHEIAQSRFLGLRADLNFYMADIESTDRDEELEKSEKISRLEKLHQEKLKKLDELHLEYQKIWSELNNIWAENRRREKT